jgi:site-specific recombinase XerD
LNQGEAQGWKELPYSGLHYISEETSMPKVRGVKGVRLRIRELPSGNKQQYLDIHEPGTGERKGRRWTEVVPFGLLTGNPLQDKEAKIRAEEFLKQRIAEREAGHTGNKTKEIRKSFLGHCEKLKEQQQNVNTRISWEGAIKHLEAFKGNVSFADLTPDFFKGFKSYLLRTAKLSPNSAKTNLARIKQAIHEAVKEGTMQRDPSATTSIKKQNKLPVHLTLEEVRKLNETPCPNEQVKAAFLFSCFTGLRYSDVDALTWDKIRDGFLEFSQQKTGDPERMPLSEEAQRILKQQETAKPSPNLRRTLQENAVFFMPTQPVVDKQLKAWAKAAKIDKRISFHKSRHTFATLGLSSGLDLYTVSKLLGHKNLATTQVYAKVIDEKKKQAVGMLPTLSRG